uniref:Protein kinase domain-containing protein n=1 Tax=Panagrolaimus davidi TaxID=227884 RepID=A0A914PBB5_9BILA
MAEYYKGYHLNSETARKERGLCYDPYSNLRNAITIAVMPFTLENINIISRELAIMRSNNSEHLLRYHKFSHIGSYFIVEFPFLLRLSDLIEIVKKEKVDYEIHGCIPQQPMVKIIYGILRGLAELHHMKIWHSKLDSKSICLSVYNAKILIANYTDIKPSKSAVLEDGPLENYMAPEQLVCSKRNTGKLPDHDFGRCIIPRITEKVDVWAVGMIIYEMVIGKPLYKKDFEQSKYYRKFIDKIMYMPLPTIDEMYPYKYAPLIDTFLSCCVERNISKRPCASELLENFKDLFNTFDSDENLILEAVNSSRSVISSFKANRMEKFACHAADEPVDAKLLIPQELMISPERLKWKRFNKSKTDYQRSCSLSFGDCHLLVKVRKKSMLLSRFNLVKLFYSC